MPVSWLDSIPIGFPPSEEALAEPNGLLAAGGDLSVPWLIEAYRNGIFPWYEDGQPILWWSPDPRMVLFPEDLAVSRSMAKLLRKAPFQVTLDSAFKDVVTACAEPRDEDGGTWITEEMLGAYVALYDAGIAHSVEVWQNKVLVGGLYGVAVGQVFFGESMFSRTSNASKYGFICLVNQLKKWDYKLIDCQIRSDHLSSLGAVEISRQRFNEFLHRFVGSLSANGAWQFDDDSLATNDRKTDSELIKT